MKKKFYTLNLPLNNVHLVKDVGIIPNQLVRNGYDSYIVGYGDRKDYSYFHSNAKNLKFQSCKKIFKSDVLNGLIWLLFNSKKIDILNLYHFKKSTFCFIPVYKLLNKKGKIYLKLDIDANAGKKMTMKPNTVKWLLTKLILGKCDLISSETKEFTDYANKNWPINIHQIPNGIFKKEIAINVKKEKIILTVGRLGTEQKATEILIEAFLKSYKNISDEWKLYLVGPYTIEFEKYLNDKFKENFYLSDKIKLLGNIEQRNELFDLYLSSSIFTMPSRWEGWCLSMMEALASKNYLLLSNIPSFREVVNNIGYGDLFEVDDIEEYSNKIINVCNMFDNGKLQIDSKIYSNRVSDLYSWEEICEKIYKYLA